MKISETLLSLPSSIFIFVFQNGTIRINFFLFTAHMHNKKTKESFFQATSLKNLHFKI